MAHDFNRLPRASGCGALPQRLLSSLLGIPQGRHWRRVAAWRGVAWRGVAWRGVARGGQDDDLQTRAAHRNNRAAQHWPVAAAGEGASAGVRQSERPARPSLQLYEYTKLPTAVTAKKGVPPVYLQASARAQRAALAFALSGDRARVRPARPAQWVYQKNTGWQRYPSTLTVEVRGTGAPAQRTVMASRPYLPTDVEVGRIQFERCDQPARARVPLQRALMPRGIGTATGTMSRMRAGRRPPALTPTVATRPRSSGAEGPLPRRM
jgi:hypothetical protein